MVSVRGAPRRVPALKPCALAVGASGPTALRPSQLAHLACAHARTCARDALTLAKHNQTPKSWHCPMCTINKTEPTAVWMVGVSAAFSPSCAHNPHLRTHARPGARPRTCARACWCERERFRV
jgi:hypothetical protein